MAQLAGLVVALVVLIAGPASAQDARSVLQAAAETLGVTDLTISPVFRDRLDWRGRPELRPGSGLAAVRTGKLHTDHRFRHELVEGRDGHPARELSRAGRWRSNSWGTTADTTREWHARLERSRVIASSRCQRPRKRRMLEILLTPHGFLKGAMASNPTAVTRNEYGGRVTVVSFIALGRYRVNGTITEQNIVHRVQTWFPNPVVGDLYYETVYTDYQDVGGGVQFPMRWHQHHDFDDGAHEPNVSGGDHSFGPRKPSAMFASIWTTPH